MKLVIDIGNTHIHLAWFDDTQLVSEFRLTSRRDRTSDEMAFWLRQSLVKSGQPQSEPTTIIISSVVPDLTLLLSNALVMLWNIKPVYVDVALIEKLGLSIDIDSPMEAGADRMVNAFSAWEESKSAAIIIDFGTATTFDVLNDKGAYCGGVIAPGINLSLEALHQATAKLPNIEIAPTDYYLGKNTITAMQAGIYYGYQGAIENITNGLRSELAIEDIRVIATGGLAGLFAKGSKVIQQHKPNLTIEGLRIIAEKYSHL